MTESIPFDAASAFQDAHAVAREQETQARLLLWDHVSDKAAIDAQFRSLLAADPAKAIAQEAGQLQDPSGRPVQVDTGVVEAVAEKARAAYSAIVPGVESQRVEELIFGTIEDIRLSFKLTLTLSQRLFYSGLAMMAVAFIAALAGGDKAMSLLFGAGGIGSVLVSSLLMNPLDRVRNAAGDLVQLQMAYLAYYKQLALLGGGSDPLSRQDAISQAREIDRAAVSLMAAVQTYVEQPKGIGEVLSASQGSEGTRQPRSRRTTAQAKPASSTTT